MWRGLADVAEKYVRAGKLLFVEGRLRTSSYDDKDGNKKYTTEILCDNFRLLGPSGNSEGGSNNQTKSMESTSVSEPQGSVPEPDDLPF